MYFKPGRLLGNGVGALGGARGPAEAAIAAAERGRSQRAEPLAARHVADLAARRDPRAPARALGDDLLDPGASYHLPFPPQRPVHVNLLLASQPLLPTHARLRLAPPDRPLPHPHP